MDSNKNCGKSSATKTLKGFTLIELLIVIAILAILAGMVSIIMPGFVRDAKIETDQNKAQMMYSTFQSFLIDCEIKQDISFFDVNTSGTEEPNAAAVFFHIAQEGNGKKYDGLRLGDKIEVKSITKNSEKSDVYSKEVTSEAQAYKKERYELFEKEIMGSVDSKLDGSYAVYIDLDNYTVDSVVYRELENGKDPTMATNYLKEYNKGVGGYKYCGLDNVKDVRNIIKSEGIYYGVYPYQDDLSSD
ncbi:MAG: type II secretion system protein [Oscillospiraceae bacterium]